MGEQGKRERRIARYVGGGAWLRAIEELQNEMKEEGEDAYSLCMLGFCHYRRGDHSQAYEACQRGLELDPGNFETLRILAKIAYSNEDHDLAAEYVSRSLDSRPEKMPALPGILAKCFRVLEIVPRWRGKGRKIEEFLRNPNGMDDEWFAWAEKYLDWYRECYAQHKRQ